MGYFDAIIQGIIQGLTEFLPVSSSGHLSLYQHFTGLAGEAGGVYAILLHMGTLAAVCVAFWPTIWGMIKEFFLMLGDIFTGRFKKDGMAPARRMLLLVLLSLTPLIVAFFFSDFFTSLAQDGDIVVEGCCFLLTAALLYLSDRCVKGNKDAATMTPRDALAMGVTQAVAPLPGLSRSGSTISVGLMMGVSREQAVAFSFIMGLPAVLAANLLEVPDALSGAVEIAWGPALVGMAVALVFGILAIKTVKWLVTNDRFGLFMWYMLALGVVTVGIGIYEHVTGALVTLA